MAEMKSLTMDGETFDSFVDKEAREAIQEFLDNPPGGSSGADGKTPYIKDGNWWIGDTDTGVKAEGVDGTDGHDGQDGKSAYAYAKDGGYTGTETEFVNKLAQTVPTDEHINSLINTALGVIENGTY